MPALPAAYMRQHSVITTARFTLSLCSYKGGNFFVTATNPAGPWSEPVWVDHSGMNPSLLFDDDGKVYYTRHEGQGDEYIAQQRLILKQANSQSR